MTASWSLSKRCWRAQAQRRQPGFLHRALEKYTCKQVLCVLALIHAVLLLLFQWQVPDVYMVSECWQVEKAVNRERWETLNE